MSFGDKKVEEVLCGAEIKREKKKASKQKVLGVVGKVASLLCACFSVVAIIAIIIFLLVSGVPGIMQVGVFKFLFGSTWQPTNTALPVSERFGIFPMIVGTLVVSAGAILVGGIIGVFTAICIAHFCPRKLRGALKQTINLLAGLPSIIYGYFGLRVLVPAFRDFARSLGLGVSVASGQGVAVSSLMLGIMILPTVVSLVLNSLEAQPSAYLEGALALGATKAQGVFKVITPASKSGILTGIVLGLGRAMGETMAVVMLCGNGTSLPESLFHSMRTMTANIVLEMGYAEGLHYQMLIATGIVLFVFVLLLTMSVSVLRRRK